ncbi:class II aldolase/adducin family protein [Algihabitans albus]|uniref:class II aldolase/adducin family protein n=1 Tax=Algihabitans albus TaxID=2164067 RepID=UPI0035CE94B8
MTLASSALRGSTRFGEAEWQARVDLAAAYHLVAFFEMHDSIFTHISAAVPGEKGHFLINPYGNWFDEVTASNLVKIDIDGRVIDDPAGLGINPAGFTIHSAVHMARHDAGCVLHTHTEAGVAVSCQADGLLPVNQWALQYYGKVAYHDYEAIALDLDERERLIADLGDQPVMILRNHGLMTVGRSIAEAWKLMFNLERTCKAQLQLQASGAAITPVPDAVCAKTAKQYWDSYDAMASGTQKDIEWAAFRRLLDRKSPGYDS